MQSQNRESLKAELVEELAAMARDQVAATGEATEEDGAEAAERFVRECYETIAPDDLLDRPKEDLVGAALALWRLGRERAPETAKIRVYNPTREEHGWESRSTAIEIVNDDMRFLVDSTTALLNGRDHRVLLVLHPVFAVGRDEGHVRRVLSLGSPEGDPVPESYMQVEVERVADREEMEAIHDELEVALGDVRAAVADWLPMRDKIGEIIASWEDSRPPVDDAEIEEATRFLRWLEDDHFTFLGYRDLDLVEEGGEEHLRLVPGASLGILRARESEASHRLRPLTETMAAFAKEPKLVFVTKANPRSMVHRPAHMDYVGVKRFGADGRVIGERRFLGLFTSSAYNRRARAIPLLAGKVERTLARAGFRPDSHDGKALLHILETFPRDELFQITEQRLFEIAMGVLQLQERQRIALFVRRDPFERFVSCLVYVPRDRFDTELRLKMAEILERAYDGRVTSHYTQVTDSPLARLHYIIKTAPGAGAERDVREIEAELTEAARTWADRFHDTLVGSGDEELRVRLFRRYRDAFPSHYRERFSVEDAVSDAEGIEGLLEGGGLGMELYRAATDAPHQLRFKIYHPGDPVPLSDAMPLLENMGVRVVSELPIEVRPAGVEAGVWIHDFDLEVQGGEGVDLAEIDQSFPDTFLRTWTGEVESDGFNRLVIRAGLTWDEVVVLRAYAKFLRQARSAFSQVYMQEALTANPRLARLLVDLFRARFDPERVDPDRLGEEAEQEVKERILEALGEVASLDVDRVLRRFLNVIESTVRTNFFQRTESGERKPYVSFKIASERVKVLPQPRPLYEIWVYSPRTEAVHLRGGKVARGGVRWSDRREDFRTEILGLMKAQMVKNAVIVPVGAKGGFVVKRPPAGADREALLQEGIACYKTMVRGMLDITDNLVDGRVVPPQRVVRRDPGDDPYLVVAADKGTAKFSDIANQVAVEYGFWLGDAFASGGSAGYDHKAMGITARGAWVAVERHFRELDHDIRNEDFTVVGVGDMSGDVFGNGMLLSRHIKLVGAFNHLHIFLDPDPDPAVSFEERKRLFSLPRSSWSDYDPSLISQGGGVFERSAKSIPLSAEVRRLLGIRDESVPPNRLIQALLTAQVDLLWFGGIGTYVKASTETNGQVGDRANDGTRVDADELRCRVIGEGANLGITQRGRIELALGADGGGKVNTDAIDNSGGVDTSDHEVNIKVLLGEVTARGQLGLEERNALLGRMTDEVAALVLRDNYLQTQAISVTESQGSRLLDAQQRMMRWLERERGLDRKLEALPDDETLAERRSSGRGLARPEISVLLAYGKLSLYDSLLQSGLLDDPLLSKDLYHYFPEPLRQAYPEAIEQHRLRREIIATYIANSMVNRVGPTFVASMVSQTGAEPADVARAYTVTREAFGLRSLWAEIEALDFQVPAQAQLEMMVAVGRVVERVTLWFLRNTRSPLDISPCTEEFGPAVQTVHDLLGDLLPRSETKELRRRERFYLKQGVPEAVAYRVAALPVLAAACDIWTIARSTGQEVEAVGRIYFVLGDRFRLGWLREAAADVGTSGRWAKMAATAAIDNLFAHQRELTRRVLDTAEAGAAPRRAIDGWIAEHHGAVERTEELLKEIQQADSLELSMLMVADDQIRWLTEEG